MPTLLSPVGLAAITLSTLDWGILIGFLVVSLGIGLWSAKSAGKNSGEFFLSGRHMPWWLLGFSMVATTFSTDTPNFVTNVVRLQGVAGNWNWWAFLITGMLTVFIYAKLWRRSRALTDIEFYELRYSGKAAAFLRGFRAIYLGVFFNVMIMAMVTLAAIKIGNVMLGWTPWQSVSVAMVVTVVFSSLGGFRGVILTDFLLFIMAMVGAFAAAWFALGHESVGGLGGLMSHAEVKDKLDIIPKFDFSNDTSKELLITAFLIPLAVQWWSVWYPGSEPGGGGYLAQRMLAAKNENHAIGSVLFFQVAHYALRPWPWVLVALASLVVFPTDKAADQQLATQALEARAAEIPALVSVPAAELDAGQAAALAELKALKATSLGCSSILKAFPDTPYDKIGHDLGYSAMLTFLPNGWLGLVLTSLMAAYMSTLSTHLNWGSSYVVNDFWKRFVRKDASERELVWAGRLSTVVMMAMTAVLAMYLESALDAFKILLQFGAGTGLLFILRWFWWRINPWSEISAMVFSFVMAVWLAKSDFGASLGYWQLPFGVAATTIVWLAVTFITPASDFGRLRHFLESTNPGGPGWKPVVAECERQGKPLVFQHAPVNLPCGILATFLGCVLVYAFLFGSGYCLYGDLGPGIGLLALAGLAGFGISRLWPKLRESRPDAS
ncbi:sodium:solute symporter family protein [Luteolibacter marinus]|uniref:sodium:solute symporter family protein n=1 Tax=Luteolibacter marinus TaxID=2776705 RepID=UPI001D034904|nr:sodium:solute symporter family protein [Luteolibacter marinus]